MEFVRYIAMPVAVLTVLVPLEFFLFRVDIGNPVDWLIAAVMFAHWAAFVYAVWQIVKPRKGGE